MRPNSLYFDRGGAKNFSRIMSLFITTVFLAFVGYILIRYKYFTYIIREEFLTTPNFGWLLILYAAVFIAFVLVLRWANCRVKRMPALWALAIFLVALAPRLYFFSRIEYVPTSDFVNFYNIGVAFTQGNFAEIAKVSADYHISSFSGLGVLNGLIMTVFGTDVRSFQLVQCVITSLSSVMVYLIARRLDEGSAPAAGLLFALYPANILFSQVTSNQHLGVFLSLTAILFMLFALSSERRVRAGVFSALSGVTLLLSNYAHPSTITTQVAFGILWLVLFLSALRNKKELLRLCIVLVAFGIAFYGVRAGAEATMQAAGLSQKAGVDSSMLTKIVIGLNRETGGAYSPSDWGMVWRQPESEQNAFCLKVIRERLTQGDLLGLFDTKIIRTWMVKDTCFGWPLYGIASVPDDLSLLLQGYLLLDFFYVAAIFLFAWIGALLRRRGSAGDLLLLVLLGTMGVYLLIEIQTRYRYFAMPLLMIFAAYGLFAIVGAQSKKKQAKTCVNAGTTSDIYAALDAETKHIYNKTGSMGGEASMDQTGNKPENIPHHIISEPYQDVNAKTIDRWVEKGWQWGLPITHEQYLAAKKGNWSIVLTPTKPVPQNWFPDLKGLDLLGLACGGGQQMPLFAASGARCTVLDYSERQLESERMVAKREGYEITVVRADMSKPLPFADASFDVIVHPVSNCYIREVEPLWRECYRVLRPGGILLAGLDNGINYIFDNEERALTHALPFDPISDPALYEELVNNDDGVQFSHTFEEQVGGQLKAGFVLTHLFEDYNGEGRLHEFHIPTFVATRAVKPKA